jgi:hypothetical protein
VTAIQDLELIFILLSWIFGMFAWYYGYQVYVTTRGRSRFYLYFFFGGLAVGMILVLRIFGLLQLYEIEDWLFAYDFFLMLSAILMMLGFRAMYTSLQEQMKET